MSLLLAWFGLAFGQGVEVGEAWVPWPPAGSLHGARPVEGRRVLDDGRVLQRVLLPPGSADALRNAGVALHQVRANHALGPPAAGYRNPTEGTAHLHRLADQSSRAHVATLGYSRLGVPLDALVLGQEPDSGAPVVRVLAAHHGDEGSSWEVALALADVLVADDGIDPRVTQILDQSTVWIVPYVNPDGAAIGSRLNADRVDLNRNYDYEWSPAETFGGPSPFSEPETRAVRAFGHHVQPFLSLSLHAGAANLGWVWNHTPAPAPDEPILEALAQAYADDCTTPGFWITNGADWYLSFGDTNDWAYGRYGVMDFTLELTELRTPLPSEIETFVADHLEALLAFLERSPTLSGTVIDAETGDPVPARIVLEGGPSVSAPFYSDADTGRFHRLADAPELLRVEAPGYLAQDVPVDGSEAFVRLQPVERRSGRFVPWALRAASPAALPEGAEGPQITLVRPGAEPVVLEAPQGVVTLEPALLAPGPWTLIDSAGTTFPDALWVDSPEAVEIDSHGWSSQELTVLGAGFSPGARAWAFAGARRVPLPLLEQAADRLVFDASALPGPPADVGLWVSGAHVSVLLDSAQPPGRPPAGCGCQGSPGAGWLWLVGLVVRRSRQECVGNGHPQSGSAVG